MPTEYSYEWCDIRPWFDEISIRIKEAANSVVNLSYTHPRGYIPNQIIRRPAIRALLNGQPYDNTRVIPQQPPANYWLPKKWGPRSDINTCPLKPFVAEIELRLSEAEAEARAVAAPCPILDLTPWHPRGGIPPQILQRLHRRKSSDWRKQTQAEIDRLTGLANKDEGFAQTQRDRKDAVEDPSKLEAAAVELLARAEQYRAQAKWLKEELG